VGDNLHVLTTGELPLSPAELLASRRMRELLGEWEAVYDYILFDTPPVLAVTDSVIIGGLCQGVLLVLHANVTSVRIVKRAEAIMEMAHVPIVGIVLNGLKIARGYGYHYSYGYRYNYNYGYGEHSENGKTRDRQSQEHPQSPDPTLPA
jgi:capsular exopolysaccharide synthesis family protein